MAAVKKPEAAYHHGDLRNALVQEAVKLVRREGVEGFSLREVARRVAVSANAAYRHFEDKDALLAAVAAQGLTLLSGRMQGALEAVTHRAPGPRAIARLRATGRAYVEFALAEPELFRLTFGRHATPPGPGSLCDDGTPDPHALLSRALDALAQAQLLPPARREGAELFAWTVVHGYASLALKGGPLSTLQPLEVVLDRVIDGLCPTASRPRREAPRATARRAAPCGP